MHAYIDACTRLYNFLIDQYLFIGDTTTGKGYKMYILIGLSLPSDTRSILHLNSKQQSSESASCSGLLYPVLAPLYLLEAATFRKWKGEYKLY